MGENPVSNQDSEEFEEKQNPTQDTSTWVCKVCGCTDTTPCPGGCAWVEKDLCSACADKAKETTKQDAP